jgi:hypothetical protein
VLLRKQPAERAAMSQYRVGSHGPEGDHMIVYEKQATGRPWDSAAQKLFLGPPKNFSIRIRYTKPFVGPR